MNYSVVLSVLPIPEPGGGTAYQVTAQLQKPNAAPVVINGRLPSAQAIFTVYNEWRRLYEALLRTLNPLIFTINPNGVNHVSVEDFNVLCKRLEKQINIWLNSHEFAVINNRIHAHFSPEDKILVILKTDDRELSRLPLHLWNFFRIFPNAELILSNLEDINIIQKDNVTRDKGRILVILGDKTNIDLAAHHRAVEKGLHVPPIPPLNEPDLKAINEELWHEKGWSVIFFAGHNNNKPDHHGCTGLKINRTDTISIELLENGLITATQHGLEILILNSCEGTDLAHTALQFGVPRIIVFREQVPNQVAVEFINYLFNALQDNSLPLAVQKARKKLQGLENKFPRASWLPVLFKNSNAPTLIVEMIQGEPAPISTVPEPTFLDQIDAYFDNPHRNKYIRTFLQIAKLLIMPPQPPKPPVPPIVVIIVIAILIGAAYRVFIESKITHTNTKLETCDLKPANNLLTCGEKSLMEQTVTSKDKTQGIAAFSKKNYGEAIEYLNKAFAQNKDPETLIFLNNAKVLKSDLKPEQIFPIAVAIPLKTNTDKNDSTSVISRFILQGVASKQDEFNNDPNNTHKLLILIANDKNDPGSPPISVGIAQQVAGELVKRKLYAVIGHYSSRATFYNKDIYTSANLVFMSSSSSASKIQSGAGLTNLTPNTYFFRVVSSTEKQAKKLADYFHNKNIRKVALFYADQDLFSGSFGDEFKKYWAQQNFGNIVIESGLENMATTIVHQNLEAVKAQKAAIVLCPGAATTKAGTKQEIKNTHQIVQENRGDLLIGGCDVFSSSEYQESIFLNIKIAKNIIVTSHSFKEIKEPYKSNLKKLWGHEPALGEELIRMSLAYDAAQVLTDALLELSKSLSPLDSTKLQKYLVDSSHKFQGITDEISFNGSERIENTSTLIKPNCSTTPCQGWEDVK